MGEVTRNYRRRGGTASAVTWIKHTSFDVPDVSLPAAKAIMLVLADYVDAEWMTRVGQPRIAHEADVGERTVRRFLAGAEAAGFLCRSVIHLGKGQGRGRDVDAIFLHVNGETDQCPVCGDQAEDLAGYSAPTNRPEMPDQPASFERPTGQIGSCTPLIEKNPEREPTEPSADGAESFAAFWVRYPKRNGKREGRRKAEIVWRRLKPPDQAAALVAVGNYAAACEHGLTIAADAFRWLRDRRFEDWQEPAVADAKRPQGRSSPLHDSIRRDLAAMGAGQ